MASIVVIGGCIVDLISYTNRFPKPGETIVGTQFCKGFGGKGANQCFMSSKLGASTAMIAKLGDDTFGQEYLKNLKENSINTDYVTFTKKMHTSTAGITVSAEGQNSIVYVPGAVMELTKDDILAAEALIKQANVLLCTYECPLETLITALKLAKKHKVTTVVNAAPATDPTYEIIYDLVDIICLNEIEAEEVTNLPVRNCDDYPLVLDALQKKKCTCIIITLGSNGAIYQRINEPHYVHIPARKVKAIDSTGAGDAFMGSLVYYLATYPHLALDDMIRRACEIATLSVLKKGTQSSFPGRDELSILFFK